MGKVIKAASLGTALEQARRFAAANPQEPGTPWIHYLLEVIERRDQELQDAHAKIVRIKALLKVKVF